MHRIYLTLFILLILPGCTGRPQMQNITASDAPEEVAVRALTDNSWSEAMPVELTHTLKITWIQEETIDASAVYFQHPIGVDLYDYGFQFQMLDTGRAGRFATAPDLKISFCQSVEEPVEITRDEWAQRIADGFLYWKASYENEIFRLGFRSLSSLKYNL